MFEAILSSSGPMERPYGSYGAREKVQTEIAKFFDIPNILVIARAMHRLNYEVALSLMQASDFVV